MKPFFSAKVLARALQKVVVPNTRAGPNGAAPTEAT